MHLNVQTNKSDIKYKPDLPLSQHILSSNHKNTRALQKLKIKKNKLNASLSGMRGPDANTPSEKNKRKK
jgi:hypothetical protein